MKSPRRGGLSFLLACMALAGHACGIPGDEADTFQSTDLRTIVRHLSRQVQLQQFAMEEMTRTGGGSGLKQQRNQVIGSKPYNTESHTGFKIAALHDHADHENTVGMGESVYVLNGVEFRTRHNDYPLYQPHPTSGVYNAVQKIEFPEVPPSVLAKETAKEQIEEMQKWFAAWSSQDHSDPNYDYRKYFKAALCYLEGGWSAGTGLEESFFSDRHFIDADSWEDLQAKVRYNTYMGRKNLLENFAYLPRTIINITEEGLPVYAQWNYRILCHPLKDDLPFSTLVQEDDLQARIRYRQTLQQWASTRGARFRIEEEDADRNAPYTLLDKLMSEIPGKDNYRGYLEETSLGESYVDPHRKDGKMLNVAYYNRRYELGMKDASGLKGGKRGFSDPSLFVAENTQEKIAPVYARMCESRGEHKCWEALKRVTYAIPLEVVYMTPLHNWNPYNIDNVEEPLSREMTEHGRRKGGFTPATAYQASGPNLFYRTPAEFFSSGGPKISGAADTAAAKVGMLDADGVVRNVTASGFRIFLPEIKNVGVLRTRYPVMPVHGEGSAVWKELNTLKQIVMQLKSHQKYLQEPVPTASSSSSSNSQGSNDGKPAPTLLYITLKLYPAEKNGHYHTVNVSRLERNRIMNGKTVSLVTDETEGHVHTLRVRFSSSGYYAEKIDGLIPPINGHSDRMEWQTIAYDDGTVTERGQRRRKRRSAEEDVFLPEIMEDEMHCAEPLSDTCL